MQANEGWDWVRIQEMACPQCGQDPAALPLAGLGPQAIREAGSWAALLATEDDGFLRVYPAPEVWSPMEYGAHVRDMLRVFGERIGAAQAEDNPTVAWFDQESAARAGRYNEMSTDELGRDIQAEAERFARLLAGLGPADWTRTAVRDGTDAFSVRGMACFAVHEAHHHLLDVNGTLGS